jgi:predicted metalloendopeptidase
MKQNLKENMMSAFPAGILQPPFYGNGLEYV